MKLLTRIFQICYSVYAFLLFVLMLFVVILFVIPASFAGRIKGGNFIYRVCSIWSDAWLFMLGIRHENIYLAPHQTNHPCIFVINHSSYMDIPILVNAIRQPMRVLAKSEMTSIPVFGFLYKKATILVDRSSAENRARTVMILKSVLRKGVSVVIFPEGTFNLSDQPLKSFYSGAFRIALEMQTPIKPVIFADTVNRLHHNSIFSLTPGKSRAIFMEEVPVTGMTIKDTEQLKEKVFTLMEAELKKWNTYPDKKPMEEIEPVENN